MSSKTSHSHFIPIWASAPAIRALVPVICGIVLQWYLPIPVGILITLFVLLGIASLLISARFTLIRSTIIGIGLQMMLFSFGALLLWSNDGRVQPSFIGSVYKDSCVVVATLQEPLVEKARSYKAEATVELLQGDELKPTNGRIIIYLQKDRSGATPALQYGSRIIFRKPLQSIRNAGNPGGFDYQRHSAFHGIYFQVFLKEGEYHMDAVMQVNAFRKMLFGLQQWVLDQFRQLIPGQTEAGVAEALLIGYRNDLDIDLVQRYSNTGVVHIIAISGMHLGLIYGLLVLLFKPFGKRRHVMLIRAVTIIGVLWLFSLLTGAAPSIVRSAIMFTFIVAGETGRRKTSIYNNLALSALLILLFDPFSLWDVGFQLSYAAVTSIAVFAKPITALLTIRHKWLRLLWELNAVTIAAQIITFPIVIYHFHQFPNLFLLTNLVAVPLSSVILYALIALLLLSWWQPVALMLGKACSWLIAFMNGFIGWVDSFSFALTDGIFYTIPQALMMLAIIAAASWWLMHRSARGFTCMALSVALFLGMRTWQYLTIQRQQRLIVYNVPQHTAIDVVKDDRHLFIGDSVLLQDGFLQNFHLKPSRVMHQVERVDDLPEVRQMGEALMAGGKKVMLVQRPLQATDSTVVDADVVILSKNPRLHLADLVKVIRPRMIVADASNGRGRIGQWQSEAQTLHLPLHSVINDGAYVLEW